MSNTDVELDRQRADLRLQLMEAGVVTARVTMEGSDGSHKVFDAALVKADGALVVDPALKLRCLRILVSQVDSQLPGWTEGAGGRSQIDWALGVDAFQHQHFDNVRFERQRLLDTASDLHASSQILADNARAALLVAMGDLAPSDKSSQQHLRDGARTLIDQARTDQSRFLSNEQRDILIQGIAGTRVRHGSEDEWITDVVWHGYVGYEHAPDVELVQKLATETLDDVVEGICGPMHITGGSDREQNTRKALIDAFALPQSMEALRAVAECWGEDMLLSLPEVDEDGPDAGGNRAPSA